MVLSCSCFCTFYSVTCFFLLEYTLKPLSCLPIQIYLTCWTIYGSPQYKWTIADLPRPLLPDTERVSDLLGFVHGWQQAFYLCFTLCIWEYYSQKDSEKQTRWFKGHEHWKFPYTPTKCPTNLPSPKHRRREPISLNSGHHCAQQTLKWWPTRWVKTGPTVVLFYLAVSSVWKVNSVTIFWDSFSHCVISPHPSQQGDMT